MTLSRHKAAACGLHAACAHALLATWMLLVLAAACQASTAPMPSFFSVPIDEPIEKDQQHRRIPLVAPSRSHCSVLEQLAHTQKRHALFQSRAVDLPSNSSQSSATNVDDKGQSIGYLEHSYYAPLNVSQKPTQTIFVQLDTGSSDLWFISASCTASQCDTDRVLKFDETKSTTFQPLVLGQNVNLTTSGQAAPRANTTRSAQNPRTTSTSTSSMTTALLEKRRTARPRVLAASASMDSDTGNVPFDVVYDDTTGASGSLAVDNVMLANLQSTDQVFGLVSDTNVTLARQGISGVLGMGFPRGSAIARSLIGTTTNISAAPLLTRLLAGTANSYPLFTLSLNATRGVLTLGAADSEILSTDEQRGQVEWHDVVPFPSGNTALAPNATVNRDAAALDSYLYWVLRLSGVGYNATSITLTSTYSQVGRNPIALIDSGTPGIVGPAGQVDALFDAIFGARHVGNGQYVVPCTTQGRLFFSFGGRNYTLLPDDYIIGPASGNPYLCLAWPVAAQAGNDGVDWVLGQAFMRAQYTLFSLGIIDREAPKIGLYPLRASPTDTNAVASVEREASVSAFVAQATPIATTLPNSLVTISSPATASPYAFINATSTPIIGLLPTSASPYAIAPSNYAPILTATTGNTQLPILASPASTLPVPSNPAEAAKDGGPRTMGGLSAIGIPAALLSITFMLWANVS